ncbi:MAG TPA: hypothetical protein VNA69_00215 [Thermoanaerobaculia bacterium]|nr:hypothetical protein [Thermoanaerobaculia bacterium]
MTPSLEPPAPLTTLQRALLWIAFLFVAATRVYALARTMWDWDEVQFAAGVREFNVGHPFHHPHPPGFPLYMLAAKLVRPLASSDFHACQTIVFLAACALFPLAFLLARELRFDFLTAYCGALLFVFFPNVWFYGGTAFSDIAGLAASLAAAVLLLRGCRSDRSFLAGAVVLGIAAGIRPQALLVGFAPFLLASWFQLRKSWSRVAIGAAIVAAIIAASYTGAALASRSVDAYQAELQLVRAWVRGVDSFLSPQRPPLLTLADDFLLRAQGGNRLPVVVAALAVLALVWTAAARAAAFIRRGRAAAPQSGGFAAAVQIWLAVAILAPFALFTWLMLDYHSVHRYSTAYVLLWALLAAEGARVLAAPLRRWSAPAQVVLLALITGRAAYWTLPALRDVRSNESPTVAAMLWVRVHVGPRQPVWVHASLEPFTEYFLFDRDVRLVNSYTELPRVGVGPRDFFASEGFLPAAEFASTRPRARLWEIARHRYFETSVVAAANVWGFGEGWYGEESDGHIVWQWMGRRSVTLLPATSARAKLRLTLAAPPHLDPVVEVRLNGATVDRFRCGATPMPREWVVASRTHAPNELEIVASETTKVDPDPRDLAVQLLAYGWEAVR